MKILTKEEEQEHYQATITGGIMGGAAGLAAGALGVFGATKRYPAFNNLTLPLKAFLMTSAGTFGAIIAADSYSRRYEAQRNPQKQYTDDTENVQEQLRKQMTQKERTMKWLQDNRYSIVVGSWVASISAAWTIVGRNPYLSGQQKLVQARVYAQGLTLAVVIISLAFETSDSRSGKGRWETVKVLDPNDPSHKHMIEKKVHHERYQGEDQWMDMIAAEEEKMKEREKAVHDMEAKDRDKKMNKAKGNGNKKDGKKEDSKKADSKKDEEEGLHSKKAEEDKDKKLNAP